MYKDLFKTFFKIGAFTFGGGYAMIPLIEEEVVIKKQWIDNEDFMDLLSASQGLPGALAVNISTFIGYRIKGLKGALAACFGAIMPSFIIISIIAYMISKGGNNEYLNAFFLGIRPAVVVMILMSVYKLSKNIDKDIGTMSIFLVASFALVIMGISPILVILSGIVIATLKRMVQK